MGNNSKRMYSESDRCCSAFLAGEEGVFSGVSLVSLLHAGCPSPAPPLVSLEQQETAMKRHRTTMVPRGSNIARERRQRLGEKTRCLQRVLPWDKKMDMATMLQETYNYVKFLQAQLSALYHMPPLTSPTVDFSSSSSPSFGGLGRLSRSQLLQVLVNSPVAQTVLYSKGCCVFSLEQLPLIKTSLDQANNAHFNLIPNPFSFSSSSDL